MSFLCFIARLEVTEAMAKEYLNRKSVPKAKGSSTFMLGNWSKSELCVGRIRFLIKHRSVNQLEVRLPWRAGGTR